MNCYWNSIEIPFAEQFDDERLVENQIAVDNCVVHKNCDANATAK